MTRDEMITIADAITNSLDAQDAGTFAGILKDRIMASYTEEELELIDSLLYSAGVDVNPICRKKHPPAPPPL
jgi:hypothetical protein